MDIVEFIGLDVPGECIKKEERKTDDVPGEHQHLKERRKEQSLQGGCE
jgi:hypothetical protein